MRILVVAITLKGHRRDQDKCPLNRGALECTNKIFPFILPFILQSLFQAAR